MLQFRGVLVRPLHVIAVVSNPVRFRSRYKLFREFEKACNAACVNFWVVECAFGERPFEVTSSGNKNHIQLRTTHEVWIKENMINIAISRLPSDWEYVAWVDADISFSRIDWCEETVRQLQHYDVVQMWSHAIDLGPEEEPIQTHESLMSCYWKSLRGIQPYAETFQDPGYYYYQPKPVGRTILWHPGYAWAARRSAINHLGGLMDWAILGAADHHMGRSLLGDGIRTLPKNIGPRYTQKVQIWQDRAEKHIKRNVGFVPGTITHHWHGSKRQRYYAERWKILTKNGYDPDLDLKYDYQGLLQLTDRNRSLRDGIKLYFRARQEDGLEL